MNGLWFASLCLFSSRMRLCTLANFVSPLYFFSSRLLLSCNLMSRSMISSSSLLSWLNLAMLSTTNPCSLNLCIKASRKVMYSGSSGSVFSVNFRIAVDHLSCSSRPPAIIFISSSPILEKLKRMSCIASLISCFVSSDTEKASFWLMMSMWCCTSFSMSGNLVISNLLKASFNLSSPKVRTILAQSLAEVSVFLRSSNTCLSSIDEISEENSSTLLVV